MNEAFAIWYVAYRYYPAIAVVSTCSISAFSFVVKCPINLTFIDFLASSTLGYRPLLLSISQFTRATDKDIKRNEGLHSGVVACADYTDHLITRNTYVLRIYPQKNIRNFLALLFLAWMCVDDLSTVFTASCIKPIKLPRTQWSQRVSWVVRLATGTRGYGWRWGWKKLSHTGWLKPPQLWMCLIFVYKIHTNCKHPLPSTCFFFFFLYSTWAPAGTRGYERGFWATHNGRVLGSLINPPSIMACGRVLKNWCEAHPLQPLPAPW